MTMHMSTDMSVHMGMDVSMQTPKRMSMHTPVLMLNRMPEYWPEHMHTRISVCIPAQVLSHSYSHA